MGRLVKRLWKFSWTDYKAAEEYLQQQAAKGLLLRSLDAVWYSSLGIIATFEKGEPQQRAYCIDAFTVSMEERDAYIQMAADSGWRLLTEINGIGIYVSEEGRAPVHMQTDWKDQYRHIRKNFWRFEIPAGFCLLLVYYLLSRIPSEEPAEPVRFMEINMAWLFFLVSLLFSINCLLRSAVYYIRSEVAIRCDVQLKPLNRKAAAFVGIWNQLLCWGMLLMIFFNRLRWLKIEILDGDLFKTVVLTVWILSFILLMLLAKVKGYENNRTLKIIVNGLWILMIVALLAYCSTGITIG